MNSLNTFLAGNPVVTLLLGALLAGILELFFPRFTMRALHRIRRGFLLDPLDLIMKDEREMHVVVASIATPEFRRIDTGNLIRLPRNAPFLPLGMAMGLAELRAAVHRRFGSSRELRNHVPEQFADQREHSFIALGGPYVHPIVKDILESGKVPNFAIHDGPCAVDETDRYVADREGPDPDAALRTDYGFIVWMRSPYNPQRRLCMLFGLWPQGALAAVDALLEPREPRRLANKFRWLVYRQRDVLAIVEVKITGLMEGKASFVKVRKF